MTTGKLNIITWKILSKDSEMLRIYTIRITLNILILERPIKGEFNYMAFFLVQEEQ